MPDGVTRQDRAALLAAVEDAGADTARRLLEHEPNELVSAALGENRAQVLKRVRHHSLQGIAAFGMLPLAAHETVLDRYLALRDSAKKGALLGPNRRHSHAAAIAVAPSTTWPRWRAHRTPAGSNGTARRDSPKRPPPKRKPAPTGSRCGSTEPTPS
ncbi:hypothetical protein IHE61_11495 [Streptomyces sp. GKU 257-1]|nr:hypothetical protein [Streptomyces sp. GKU 257-1]